MKFQIQYSTEAKDTIAYLQSHDQKKYRKVIKTLALMESNLRHPSLNTHKYLDLYGPNGEEVFEAYVENKTPAAYRIFWYYGLDNCQITILAITHHP